MAGRLVKELRQSKQFPTLEGEAALNILRTSEVIHQKLNDALKQFDLTFTQYNVLRILRGAGEQGTTCSDLGERLIARDPDITRLLDRLERRALVVRQRSVDDRRIVLTVIHPNGLALLEASEKPVRNVMVSNMGRLSREKMLSLIACLEEVRTER